MDGGCGTRRCLASLTPREWRRQHPYAPAARTHHGVSLVRLARGNYKYGCLVSRVAVCLAVVEDVML